MNKIVEALKKLLPEEHLKEVSAAVEEMLAESAKEIGKQKEAEYNKELEKAYQEFSNELAKGDKTGEQGYEEAFAIIADLRNRLDVQEEEFKQHQDKEFAEAYELILAERAKNNSLEVDLYEEYDLKYKEMKNMFVEMIDKFLQTKGVEIYENAKRDIMNDPRYAEHKVALDKIVDITSNYLSDEDYALATSSKLEEAKKQIEELRGQVKLTEARSIRLGNEKRKLEESVRRDKNLLTEVKKNDKNERVQQVKNVTGRGRIAADEDTRVLAEHNPPVSVNKDTSKSVLVESLGIDKATLGTLAGLNKVN